MASSPGLGANYRRLFAAGTISNLGDGIGTVAYPWLASAVTRDGFLIALVVVVQRLPWLVFSLPAGVLTDRHGRQRLMVAANTLRAVMTAAVAVAVWARRDRLVGPSDLEAGADIQEDVVLYVVILAATFLLGMAEVVHDNAAQSFMPRVVPPAALEKANGRLWSAEQIANTFVGPPLGALLLTLSFAVPFGVDAVSFGLSAALVALIRLPATTRSPGDGNGNGNGAKPSWKAELVEGVRWLWGHELLRPLAVILGLFNLLGTLSASALVLFAQEVLETSPTEFAILNTGGAIGAVVGGTAAPMVSRRLGQGPALWTAIAGGGISSAVIGLTSYWPIAWISFAVFMFLAVVWNVITVSLRQEIIPDHLLGRVNSVYRFFAWGSMPLGAAIGGLVIVAIEPWGGRTWALRAPWLVAAVGHLPLLLFAIPRLTTVRMERARAAGDASDGATTAD